MLVERGPAHEHELPATLPGTKLQAVLLYTWSRWAGDPAAEYVSRLAEGTPAGISRCFHLDGILEPTLCETPLSVDELSID